jgi:hypothetical protein
MTAASIYGSPPKLRCGGKSARRTRFPWGETGVPGEGTDKRSQGARRGMGPGTCARVAEITSGRAVSQQGLTATCKDHARKEESEAQGGFRSGAWARTSDDGGVMPSQAAREAVPPRGNAPRGQRSPGYSVASRTQARKDMAGTTRSNLPPSRSWRRMSRPGGKPAGRCTTRLPSDLTRVCRAFSRLGGWQTIGARGVCGSALELPHRWAGQVSDKWRAEPRPEPDSGNPTVRDRRGALRNVADAVLVAPARALNFYPDTARTD